VKEVVEAVNNRLNTPYFGYAIWAFLALNWRGFFYLVLSKGKPEEKLALFDSHTDLNSLLVYPLAIGVIVAATAHWLKYLFAIIEKKPKELFEELQLEAEHNKTIKQTQLEQSRSELFAIKENELIDRAKRDEAVADIEDSETKEKLVNQLNSIRNERDKLSQELEKKKEEAKYQLSKEAEEIVRLASKDKKGRINITSTLRGKTIVVGNKSFSSDDKRTFVKYESGIDQLSTQGLIKQISTSGSHELTLQGWEMADAL
jgi:hypothetical protein